MKIRLPIYLRDRTGWIRPRVLPSVLNMILVSAGVGLAAGVSLAYRDARLWVCLSLGSLTGVVCLWILAQRQAGEWARQGTRLYREARLRYVFNNLLLTPSEKREALLPAFLQGDDAALILHEASKTEIVHILPVLREGKRVLYLCEPLSDGAREFLKTPPAPTVEIRLPEEFSERLLAVSPHLPEGALASYAAWARSRASLRASPGQWIRKSRVLRLFWVAAMLWLVSGWTHLRLWYQTAAVLLALAALAWALWPWARRFFQDRSHRSAVSP